VTTRTRRNDLGQPSFGPAYEVLNLSSGDDSERTEVEGCVAVHDQVGMLPWSLGGRIGVLFGHPVGVGGGGDFTRGHACRVAGLAYRLRRLYPDDHIQFSPHRFLTRANPQ